MRGPAIEPSLVTWPTMMTGSPRSFATRMRVDATSRTWLGCPAMPSDIADDDRLDRVDDQQLGPHLVDVSEDRREVGLGGDVELVVQRAGALGAQPHLRRGLLGARVQHAPPAARALRRDLEQQRRLADAGLAAQQDGGAGHDAAAEHAVELADPARAPRGVGRVDRRDRPRGPPGARRDRRRPSA